MVMQRSSAKTNTQLDIAKLPSGIYLVKVINGEKESTVKIVKE
jgi:hypothetical protein